MANTQQAPALCNVGKDLWKGQKGSNGEGRLEIDNRIFYHIYKTTGPRSKAPMGVMLFLLGCKSDGSFKIPEALIENRLGIKRGTYYDALGVLEELGYIDRVQGQSITIRYDKLYEEIIGSTGPDQSIGAESIPVDASRDGSIPIDKSIPVDSGGIDSKIIGSTGVDKSIGIDSGAVDAKSDGSTGVNQDWRFMF